MHFKIYGGNNRSLSDTIQNRYTLKNLSSIIILILLWPHIHSVVKPVWLNHVYVTHAHKGLGHIKNIKKCEGCICIWDSGNSS